MGASTKWNPNLQVSKWSGDKKKKKKYHSGGMMRGASHANGGIDIEVEGGEFIINKKSTAYIEKHFGANFLHKLNKLGLNRASRRSSTKRKSKKTFSKYGMGE